jgi:hypothetical protein
MKDFDLEHNEKINPGFKIPPNYFEQFEATMMEQIQVKKETKVVSLFYKKQIWISAIAAVFLLAIAIPVYFNIASEQHLDANTIESYLADQQSLETTELTKHLTNEDISELENTLVNENVTDETIENYLSETGNLDDLLIE